MKLYLACVSDDYEGVYILGVFDSEEKAQMVIDNHDCWSEFDDQWVYCLLLNQVEEIKI